MSDELKEEFPSSMMDHVILCDSGHVGPSILDLLLRMGEDVVVIAAAPRKGWKEMLESMCVPLYIEDGSHEKVLREAGVEKAKSVLITTDDDLFNVSMALDAKRLNPKTSVVVQLYDQQLAQRLEAAFGIDRALSISTLVAPVFAASALGQTTVGSFTVDGIGFIASRIKSPDSGRTDTTVAQLTPTRHFKALAHLRAAGMQLIPQENARVGLGEELVVLGPVTHWVAAMIPSTSKGVSGVGGLSLASRLAGSLRPSRLLKRIRRAWAAIPYPLRIVFWALLSIFMVSITVFHLGMNLAPLDALYFVSTIFTTVGFGDIGLLGATPAVKVYGIFLMFCGAALTATLFSIVTDFIVAARFREMLGMHKIPQEGHVVLAGLGNVGYRVLEQFRHAGLKVVAIEKDKGGPFIELAQAKASVIVGDAGKEEVLLKAGIAGATAVVAATDDDIQNLGIGLLARQMNPGIGIVLRMANGDLARKVQGTLNVNAVLSSSALAAPTFVGSALFPDVIYGLILEKHALFLLHRKYPEGSRNIGQTVQDVEEGEGISFLFRKLPQEKEFLCVSRESVIGAGEEFIAMMTRPLS